MAYEKYIHRCLTLAAKGKGHVSPNPLVGAVIVRDGKIIGEGFHAQHGQAHAEVNAINSVQDKAALKESTLYVNLEPCSHHGKTPPCASRIIEEGIPQVVMGCLDPNEQVAGRGVKQLKDSGVHVISEIMAEECKWLNRRFFTFHQQQRPYIILKWAQTADGFMADSSGNSKWISNLYSRIYVHKWRAQEDAIMVGRQTAMNDDPKLTARLWQGNDPMRIVLDPDLSMDSSAHLLDGSVKTWVLNQQQNMEKGNKTYLKLDLTDDWLAVFLAELKQAGCQSLIVEGGKALLDTFIQHNAWDEARIFTGKTCFGQGLAAPVVNGQCGKQQNIAGDELKFIYNS